MVDIPADQLALLRSVIADPDADTPRLVYADWLEDAGDAVQAEYIRDSVRLARLPADAFARPELEARLTAVLVEHADRWTRALGLPVGPPLEGPDLPADAPKRLYRRGLVHTLWWLSPADYVERVAPWYRVLPVEGVHFGFPPETRGLQRMLPRERDTAFAGRPELGRLRSLGINAIAFGPDFWRRLLRNPALAGLRRLDVSSGCGFGEDAFRLLADQPHLSELEVLDLGDVPGAELHEGLWAVLDSPHLRGLRVILFDAPDTDLGPYLTARLTDRCGPLWGPNRPPPRPWC